MPATTVAVSRRRLTLATGVQLGGRVLGAFLGVAVAASLARSLSRPAFGELALALTILNLAANLGDLGMGQIAVREMARRPDDRASIAGALVAAQLTMGVVLAVVGTGIAFALMGSAAARIMAVCVMVTLPFGAAGALTIAAQARLRPELVIIPALVQNVLWLAIVLALGAAHAGLALYGAGTLGAGAIQAVVIVVLTRQVTAVRFAGTWRLIVELLKLGWPIGLAGVFVTAYYRIDAILLFDFRGATSTAYYGAAYRVLDVLQILPMTISGVLFPLLASAQRERADRARIQGLLGLAVGMLLALALPVAVCGAILAPKIVVLIYGQHYRPAILLLQILLPAFIPICLGYVFTGQLILHGLLRPYIVITFAGAVINVAANALAIPRYGAPAAAWATLGTEALVVFCVMLVVRRRAGISLPLGRTARCLAAVALTGAAVWLVRDAALAVAVGVAAVVHPASLLVTRALSIGELRMLLTREAAASA